MTTPKRIQQRRTKDWRKPEGARPVISMTPLTREALMLWVAAMVRRCERALRPGVHGACLQQGADLA